MDLVSVIIPYFKKKNFIKESILSVINQTYQNLEIFMDIKGSSDREVQWMIIVHLVFIVSGVLLALMDFIASKTSKH